MIAYRGMNTVVAHVSSTEPWIITPQYPNASFVNLRWGNHLSGPPRYIPSTRFEPAAMPPIPARSASPSG